MKKAIKEINDIDKENNFLRIAVMHHNFLTTSFVESENLKDADKLLPILLKNSFKLILHGHEHTDKEALLGKGDTFLRILGTGSAGLDSETLPDNSRRYQIIQIIKDKDNDISYKVFKRRFDSQKIGNFGKGCWVPDVDPYEKEIFLELHDLVSLKGIDKSSSLIIDSFIRGGDILKIAFPKQEIKFVNSTTDSKNKIYYEYFSINIGYGKDINHLFIGKNINISATLKHFLENNELPEIGLTICTPRIKSKITKDAEFRATNIKDIFKGLINRIAHYHNLPYEVLFIDQYLWNNCLDKSITSEQIHEIDTDIFIDQNLYLRIFEQTTMKEKDMGLCMSFFQDIFSKKLEDDDSNPIHVIFGYGGVGKTTFCDKLVSMINGIKNKRAIYIKSSDLLGKIEKVETNIHSISDLFKLYDSHTGNKYASLHEPFNLDFNISCGNISVIIDGLDEIESYLKYKFDIELFLQSLIDLHEQFNNCKVIITSRDYQEDKYKNRKGIDIYSLKGFDDGLLGLYLSKRFSQKSKEERARGYLKQFNLKYENRYMPLSISLISEIVDREEINDDIVKINTFNTSILRPQKNIIDELIYRLIEREILKQDLNISIDHLIGLFFEIAIDYKGNMSIELFNEYVELSFPQRSAKQSKEKYYPYYKNPLLVINHSKNYIQLRYDFLNILVKSRYIQKCITEKVINKNLINLLSENAYGLGPVLEEMVKVTENDIEFIDNISNIIQKLVKDYHKFGESKNIEFIQKAISALLYYSFSVAKIADKKDGTNLIKTIYKNNLNNIFIFGEFYPLDFNHVTIRDSHFIGYNNLIKSIFPKNDKVFYYCTFKDIEIKGTPYIPKNIFDDTCGISDELKFNIALGAEKSEELFDLLKKDLTGFLGNFLETTKFVDKNINQIHLKFTTNLNKKKLLDEALQYKIMLKRQKKQFELYYINSEYYLSVLTLINQNRLEPILEKFCIKIMGKYFKEM